MFEKEYSMKTDMCTQEPTLPGRTNMLNLQCNLIFDSLETLNIVTTGHESSRSVYFSGFSGQPSPHKFLLSKAVSHLAAKVLKIISLYLNLQCLNFLIMVFASFNCLTFMHSRHLFFIDQENGLMDALHIAW